MIHKRHEGIPARPASYLLLATSLSAILILRGATPTAAAKMKTVDTMDDDSDMVEDFAREMMEESMFNMYVSLVVNATHYVAVDLLRDTAVSTQGSLSTI